MKQRTFYVEIFTTAFAAIVLEIAYTRIFSFKVFYYFTYFIIGLGLLGLGAGGVAVAVSEKLRRWDPARLVALSCAAGGASVLLGYVVISPLPLNVAKIVSEPGEIVKLALSSLLLTAPFAAVGIVLSTILGSRPEAANRLYGVDLIGAALGCTLAIPLLKAIDPPRTVLLAGLVLSLGGLRSAYPSRVLTGLGVASAVVLAIPLLAPSLLRDPIVAENKHFEEYRKHGLVTYSKWNPVFRIDVSEDPFKHGELYLLHHDGMPGSALRRFDGDLRKFESLRQDGRSLPFEVLPRAPKVLVIGSAGGHEIVASLFFGAKHVTGVELNSETLSLLTGKFADYTGRLHENPKVTLVNGDGRWFLKQTSEQYDLIWFVAPDSYAAMNVASSGSFVLSESYLYTVEMIGESLRHLTSNGLICTQFGELDYNGKPNRTTRYLATAREALARSGVAAFSKHVMVSSAAGLGIFLESVVLVGGRPFSPEQVARFVAQTEHIKGSLRHVPGRNPDSTPVTQVITLPETALGGYLARHRYQVDPVRDDSPFFWHFARFRDALRAPLPGDTIIDFEDSVAEVVTLVFLGLIVVLAAALLLLPFGRVGPIWSKIPYKTNAALYFAALGLGFMFVEVALIQKFTLLLGYPTYSLSVTLCALLVFSGLGSMLSTPLVERRNRALFALLAAVSVLIGSYQLVLPWLIERFVGGALPLRITLTLLLIAPVGLCLGAFMPLGLRTVAKITEHRREYVAWAWAINGFFSVIASILSTILAMVIGFHLLMLAAVAIYAVGVLALSRIPFKAGELQTSS